MGTTKNIATEKLPNVFYLGDSYTGHLTTHQIEDIRDKKHESKLILTSWVRKKMFTK